MVNVIGGSLSELGPWRPIGHAQSSNNAEIMEFRSSCGGCTHPDISPRTLSTSGNSRCGRDGDFNPDAWPHLSATHLAVIAARTAQANNACMSKARGKRTTSALRKCENCL